MKSFHAPAHLNIDTLCLALVPKCPSQLPVSHHLIIYLYTSPSSPSFPNVSSPYPHPNPRLPVLPPFPSNNPSFPLKLGLLPHRPHPQLRRILLQHTLIMIFPELFRCVFASNSFEYLRAAGVFIYEIYSIPISTCSERV